MSDMTTFLEGEVINALRGTNYSAAGLFVKLHIGDPGEAGTANPAAETSRQSVTLGAPAGSPASSSNTNELTWSSVSTTETYTHASLWDTIGPTGGNALMKTALVASQPVTAGDDARIPIGDLTVTMD